MKSCLACFHYISIKSDAEPAEKGLCRRFPPTIVSTPAGLQSAFSQVPGDWLCGEHQINYKANRIEARKPKAA